MKNILERFVEGVLRTKYLFLETSGLNGRRFERQIKAIPVNEKTLSAYRLAINEGFLMSSNGQYA